MIISISNADSGTELSLIRDQMTCIVPLIAVSDINEVMPDVKMSQRQGMSVWRKSERAEYTVCTVCLKFLANINTMYLTDEDLPVFKNRIVCKIPRSQAFDRLNKVELISSVPRPVADKLGLPLNDACSVTLGVLDSVVDEDPVFIVVPIIPQTTLLEVVPRTVEVITKSTTNPKNGFYYYVDKMKENLIVPTDLRLWVNGTETRSFCETCDLNKGDHNMCPKYRSSIPSSIGCFIKHITGDNKCDDYASIIEEEGAL